jgi:DNA-binding transcriptional LysR family regulator
MPDADFLEPERLRAFVAVAETGSFSRAAERLRLAQPTISIQVRRLEESIGYSLLTRGTSVTTLTQHGEAMLGYARELLAVMERARRQFAQPPLAGSVRLGLVEDFNYAAFSEMLRGLQRQYAEFELSVTVASAAHLQALLHTNALDIVLSKRLAGGTDGESICRQAMAWVGRSDPLAAGDAVPLVLTPSGSFTREIVLSALRQAGRPWSIRFEAPSIAGLHAAVQAGMGITALGVGMIPPDLIHVAKAAQLPSLPDAEFVLGLNTRCKDTVVAAFADIIRHSVPLIVARMTESQN